MTARHAKYSIIIPTLNQAKMLKECLRHISKLNCDALLYEVVVVDNGSSDNTKEIALSFQDRITNLEYVYCEALGLMAARHRGYEEAHGEILCYIDDDSMVTKKWLNGIADAFTDENVVLVGGPSIPQYESAPPDWMEYFWHETEFGMVNNFLSLVEFGEKKIEINPVYVFGCNYSIRKNIFSELDGTHPDYLPEKYKYYQGDGESGLSREIFELGYKTVYEPLAKIYHLIPASRLTVDYFCQRRYFNGIHVSYSEIRRSNRKELARKERFIGTLARLAKGLLNEIKEKVSLFEPRDVRETRRKIRMNFKKGFSLHQLEVKNNPKLLEWVLRDNYLGQNGRLPD